MAEPAEGHSRLLLLHILAQMPTLIRGLRKRSPDLNGEPVGMCQAKEGEVGIVWLVLENIYIYIF